MQEKKIDNSIFWDINRTLTYNALFNFIVGNRGGGKTYGGKQRAIENFLRRREQFGYVRRYKDDLKEPMRQFFKDIEGAYPNHEFKTDSKYFFIREKPTQKKQPWTEEDIAGHGFSLSTANNKKSISYPDITLMLYDEFLLDKGNQTYLSNEPEKFLNLYETVARPGTGHKRVVAFFLANAITETNPYFLYFDLAMPTQTDKNNKYIWRHPTKPILVEDVKNAAFIDVKKNTEFGQLVAGTKYADFSIENKFFLDDDNFVEKKSSQARYLFTFIYKAKKYGVWVDYGAGKMWVSENIDPSALFVYTLTLKDHQPNTMFIKTRSKNTHFNSFVENYKMGNVFFENINVKNITYEVIKMVMT